MMQRFFCRLLLAGAGIAAWLLLTADLAAQHDYRPPSGYVQFGKPDQEKGRTILEDFRRQGIAGPYYLDFSLRVMPRRGPDRLYHGGLHGARNAIGPVERVSLRTGGDAAADPGEIRLLIQNGPTPGVWSWSSAHPAPAGKLGVVELFQPIAGTDLTAFDLQMPFIYWENFAYEGLARFRGRPAHQFLLQPPADFAAQYPALAGVRVYLDAQFNALVQAELIGKEGRLLKSIAVLDLRKVGGQWIVQSIDLRDETTRNKTRFQVRGAALNLVEAPFFEPAELLHPAPPPPKERITWLE